MYALGAGVPQDYVQAHMWFNLAASKSSRIRDMAISDREAVASRMTPEQLAEAQRLAREWQPK
jgi:TPR repeat protein